MSQEIKIEGYGPEQLIFKRPTPNPFYVEHSDNFKRFGIRICNTIRSLTLDNIPKGPLTDFEYTKHAIDMCQDIGINPMVLYNLDKSQDTARNKLKVILVSIYKLDKILNSKSPKVFNSMYKILVLQTLVKLEVILGHKYHYKYRENEIIICDSENENISIQFVYKSPEDKYHDVIFNFDELELSEHTINLIDEYIV